MHYAFFESRQAHPATLMLAWTPLCYSQVCLYPVHHVLPPCSLMTVPGAGCPTQLVDQCTRSRLSHACARHARQEHSWGLQGQVPDAARCRKYPGACKPRVPAHILAGPHTDACPACDACPCLPFLQADPNMANMMKTMQDPSYKEKVEGAMKAMKDDPELKPMMEELEAQGPMAMMKWVSAWREQGGRLRGVGGCLCGGSASGSRRCSMSAVFGRLPRHQLSTVWTKPSVRWGLLARAG
eukprot:355593-Chlamydomonas_euryale.AAC.4